MKTLPAHISSHGWGLLVVTLIICLIGLVFVFEASVAESFATFGDQYHFLKHQSMWLMVGWAGLFVSSFLPIKLWQKFSPLLYIFSVILLILVFIPGIGREFNGAHRWLNIFGITVLQPVEVVKFALITFFAHWMVKHQRIMPFLFLTGIPTALLFLQPDLGSSLIVLAIAYGMYFIAGGDIKSSAALAIMGIIIISLVIFSSPYKRARVATYLNPELDPLGSSFHIRQITLALGRGGLLGEGVGNSKQKFSFIPEASTDSIFAIAAEEIGFTGSLVILSLYCLYFYLAFTIISKLSPGSFEYLLGSGILVWVSFQTLLNIAAVVALVPLTGIPLPFFSYGGSSLVMILFATGILIKMSKS